MQIVDQLKKLLTCFSHSELTHMAEELGFTIRQRNRGFFSWQSTTGNQSADTLRSKRRWKESQPLQRQESERCPVQISENTMRGFGCRMTELQRAGIPPGCTLE